MREPIGKSEMDSVRRMLRVMDTNLLLRKSIASAVKALYSGDVKAAKKNLESSLAIALFEEARERKAR